MTTVDQPQVGAAAFVAALTTAGFDVSERNEQGTLFAVFPYTIEVGSRTGETVRAGLAVPGDWPMSPPPGPHVSPRLGHPDGAVHPSPLGEDFEYWSRPASNWPDDRSVRGYLRHLRTLFAKR